MKADDTQKRILSDRTIEITRYGGPVSCKSVLKSFFAWLVVVAVVVVISIALNL